jgi:retinol dehydrogenase-12
MLPDLSGQVIFVTGATGGIGLESVKALARRNAHVIVGARDRERGQKLVDALRTNAELVMIDLASSASIHAAAEHLIATHSRLDVLINNAGMVSAKRKLSIEGHEVTWATNVLGPYLLTQLLLPLLLAAERPRVVNVGSSAHRSGRLVWEDLEFERRRYVGFSAYAQSKLALTLLTRQLAAREPHITASCVHPGAIATGIWRELPAPLRLVLGRLLPAPQVGAAPVVRLAGSAGLLEVSGSYYDKFRAVEPSLRARDDAAADRLAGIVAAQTGA